MTNTNCIFSEKSRTVSLRQSCWDYMTVVSNVVSAAPHSIAGSLASSKIYINFGFLFDIFLSIILLCKFVILCCVQSFTFIKTKLMCKTSFAAYSFKLYPLYKQQAKIATPSSKSFIHQNRNIYSRDTISPRSRCAHRKNRGIYKWNTSGGASYSSWWVF